MYIEREGGREREREGEREEEREGERIMNQAVAQYKKRLRDADVAVVMDNNTAQVYVPKRPVPSVNVRAYL